MGATLMMPTERMGLLPGDNWNTAVCLPATLIAFLVGQSILSEKRLDIALTEPGVARAVVGSALYLSAVGLLGLGLGALLRSTAGAVAALLGLLLGPQLLVGLLPSTWSDQLYRYLPVPAGERTDAPP